MLTFKNLLSLLNPIERRNAILLVIMIIIMALLDMIGVASILPFIAVLTNDNLVEQNIILNKLFLSSNVFGIENKDQFLFFFRHNCIFIINHFSNFQSHHSLYAK